MLEGYTVVATKSTVPVGTGRQIGRIIREQRPDAAFDVVSNPEFLREGSAIDDFMRPDRVIVGVESSEAQAVMRALYRPLFLIETPVLFTSLETAELIKYAANCFLATKITFINEIADICERIDADVQDVAKGIGTRRPYRALLPARGPGLRRLVLPQGHRRVRPYRPGRPARPAASWRPCCEATPRARRRMTDKIVQACGGSVAGKTVAVLGVTFKPNTDDVRESPSLVILPGLAERGATVRAFDPAGMDEARSILGGVDWCPDAYDAMADADALVILTEWNEFRALDLARVKGLMRTPLIVDLRNIYEPEEVAAAGFRYVSIGRPEAESPAEAADRKVRRLHATG